MKGFLQSLKGEKLPESPMTHSMDELVSAEHHQSVQGLYEYRRYCVWLLY